MPVRGQCGECDGTTHGGGRDQPGPGSLNTFMWWVLRAGREFTKQIGGTSPPRKQDQNARSLKGRSKLHTWMGTLQGVGDRRVGVAPERGGGSGCGLIRGGPEVGGVVPCVSARGRLSGTSRTGPRTSVSSALDPGSGFSETTQILPATSSSLPASSPSQGQTRRSTAAGPACVCFVWTSR